MQGPNLPPLVQTVTQAPKHAAAIRPHVLSKVFLDKGELLLRDLGGVRNLAQEGPDQEVGHRTHHDRLSKQRLGPRASDFVGDLVLIALGVPIGSPDQSDAPQQALLLARHGQVQAKLGAPGMTQHVHVLCAELPEEVENVLRPLLQPLDGFGGVVRRRGAQCWDGWRQEASTLALEHGFHLGPAVIDPHLAIHPVAEDDNRFGTQLAREPIFHDLPVRGSLKALASQRLHLIISREGLQLPSGREVGCHADRTQPNKTAQKHLLDEPKGLEPWPARQASEQNHSWRPESQKAHCAVGLQRLRLGDQARGLH
mmetsp:Transcript_75269/g.234355  ORF Transcript_75269/g.234355 Transcript_75269/m.234355 type:complete len:312 (-) Transcript_75269:77-1012(-)